MTGGGVFGRVRARGGQSERFFVPQIRPDAKGALPFDRLPFDSRLGSRAKAEGRDPERRRTGEHAEPALGMPYDGRAYRLMSSARKLLAAKKTASSALSGATKRVHSADRPGATDRRMDALLTLLADNPMIVISGQKKIG